MSKSDQVALFYIIKNTRLSKGISIGQSAKWINAENIGKTDDEMIVIWNELHPDDPIEV